MNAAKWAVVSMFACSVIACAPSADRTQTTITEKPKVTKLIISKRQDGQEIPVGTLVFDASNKGNLTVSKPGTDGEELKRVWSDISAKDRITWKRALPQTVNGKEIMAVDGTDIAPGENDYKWAVQDNLQRKYGYTVDSKEE